MSGWIGSYKNIKNLENSLVKILKELRVQTDMKINANQSDIIPINFPANKSCLIDVLIPSGYNIGHREEHKL